MASRQVYPTASSSTSLDRDQKPPPLDFSRQFSEEDEVAPYNYQPDPEYHAQYPSSHYLSPAVNNALRETPSSTSLVPSDGGTSEQGMNGGNNWSTRRPPVKKRSWIAEAFFPDSVACRLYLMIVVVETLLDLAIECIILVRVNHAIDVTSSVSKEDSPTLARSRIPVYLGVFGMAHVFQFMLALDAVYYKNVLQFVFLAIFNALFFVRLYFSFIQFKLGGLTDPIPSISTRSFTPLSKFSRFKLYWAPIPQASCQARVLPSLFPLLYPSPR